MGDIERLSAQTANFHELDGIEDVATAGPGAAASATEAFCTKVPAVTSANAMIT